jgi:hypothetical protein
MPQMERRQGVQKCQRAESSAALGRGQARWCFVERRLTLCWNRAGQSHRPSEKACSKLHDCSRDWWSNTESNWNSSWQQAIAVLEFESSFTQWKKIMKHGVWRSLGSCIWFPFTPHSISSALHSCTWLKVEFIKGIWHTFQFLLTKLSLDLHLHETWWFRKDTFKILLPPIRCLKKLTPDYILRHELKFGLTSLQTRRFWGF